MPTSNLDIMMREILIRNPAHIMFLKKTELEELGFEVISVSTSFLGIWRG
jgi:hypothetical protein